MINNAEHTLPHVLQQLDALSCVFSNTFFLFFESNSVDRTTLILEEWRQNKSMEPGTAFFDSFCAQIIDAQLIPIIDGTRAANHVQSVQKQVERSPYFIFEQMWWFLFCSRFQLSLQCPFRESPICGQLRLCLTEWTLYLKLEC